MQVRTQALGSTSGTEICAILSRVIAPAMDPQMPTDKGIIEYLDSEAPPDNTAAKQETRFQKGVSGNPKGRPKGSRNRLGEAFLNELNRQFEVHGADVVSQLRIRDPAALCKLVAGLLPREIVLASLNVNAKVDLNELEQTEGYLAAYRYARDRIGAAAPLIEAEAIDVEAGSPVGPGRKSIDD